MIKLWQFFLCTFFLLCTLFRGVLGQWSWGVLYKLSSFARVDTSVRSIEATTTVSICETWSQLLNIVSSLECTNHRWKKTIICFRVSINFDRHFIDKWHYIIWNRGMSWPSCVLIAAFKRSSGLPRMQDVQFLTWLTFWTSQG